MVWVIMRRRGVLVDLVVFNDKSNSKQVDFLMETVTLQCLPFYIINEVGHLTTSVDHLAEFCQNYRLAAICTQLMVKFFYN